MRLPKEIFDGVLCEDDIGRISFNTLPDHYEKSGWVKIAYDRGAVTYAKGTRRITVFPYGKIRKWRAK